MAAAALVLAPNHALFSGTRLPLLLSGALPRSLEDEVFPSQLPPHAHDGAARGRRALLLPRQLLVLVACSVLAWFVLSPPVSVHLVSYLPFWDQGSGRTGKRYSPWKPHQLSGTLDPFPLTRQSQTEFALFYLRPCLGDAQYTE
jgi:hypothetical protein